MKGFIMGELPDRITISWHISDVMELWPELTASEARAILRYVEKNHDANVGINYDVITSAADFVLSQDAKAGLDGVEQKTLEL